MFDLWEAYLLSNGTFASRKLESQYLALFQEAVQTDFRSRHGPNQMTIAKKVGARESYTVDLTDPQDKSNTCSCGCNKQSALFCVHVCGAILHHGCLGKQLEIVMPKGAMRQADGTSPFTARAGIRSTMKRAKNTGTTPICLRLPAVQ